MVACTPPPTGGGSTTTTSTTTTSTTTTTIPASHQMLAVAYSNLDGVDGYDPAGSDVLIAKLVDTNDDGVPSVGDTVVADRYPVDFDASAFGRFRATTHTVTSILIDCCAASLYGDIDGGAGEPGGGTFQFIAEPGTVDPRSLQESFSLCASSACAGFADSGYYSYQLVVADPGAPGDPDTVVPRNQVDPRTGVGVGDDAFVDADFLW
jgi:hypothetical protein